MTPSRRQIAGVATLNSGVNVSFSFILPFNHITIDSNEM
jgi:hypothetical protein